MANPLKNTEPMRKRLSKTKFLKWYKYRFSRNYGKSFDSNYMNEWMSRFESPRKAWGSADAETRRSLIKFFPKTFKGLKLSDNLYNQEWGNKYLYWGS